MLFYCSQREILNCFPVIKDNKRKAKNLCIQSKGSRWRGSRKGREMKSFVSRLRAGTEAAREPAATSTACSKHKGIGSDGKPFSLAAKCSVKAIEADFRLSKNILKYNCGFEMDVLQFITPTVTTTHCPTHHMVSPNISESPFV